MKFGIAAKLVTLLIVLVCTTAGILVWRLWGLSSEIVIRHEVGDLNEETRLCACEVQDQLEAARYDVLRFARGRAMLRYRNDPADDPEDLPQREDLTLACRQFMQDPTRSGFLTLQVWDQGEQGEEADAGKPIASATDPASASLDAQAIVSRLAAARPFDPYMSNIEPMATDDDKGRVRVVWCGVRIPRSDGADDPADDARDLFVVAAINLDEDLPNGEPSPFSRLTASPRHLAFLINEMPPVRDASDSFQDDGKATDPADIPSLLFLDETKAGHVDPQRIEANFARIFDERHSLRDVDTFVHTLLPDRKGTVIRDNELPMSKPICFLQSRAIEDDEVRDAINAAVDARASQWAREMPGTRIGPLRGAVTNVRIQANSEKDARRLSKLIEEAVPDTTSSGNAEKIAWNPPVACKTCIVQYVLFPVRSSLSEDGTRYYGLAQAAFREEMKADVDRELGKLIVPSLLIVCLVALVGFITSIVFTRPLQKMTVVAESVGRTKVDPDPNKDSWRHDIDMITAELPATRRDEIGVLARAFKQMIGEVVEGHERLRLLNADLDRRVRDRTIELEETNEELKSARDKANELNHAKDAFLASVSHELRNPLNQVSGFCQLLELTELDEEQLADLGKIQRASEQLLDLINDILDYQKIVMGGLVLEPDEFEVVELLKEVRDAMEFPSREHKNELHVSWSNDVGTINADKQRLRQVLINLAGNACKFTNEGTVRIHAKRAASAGVDHIVFSVEDTGRGMLPEEQAKLFTPFTKLSAKQGNRTGTGLGLVISKGFCELMGGGIEMESEFGKGTKFVVDIPAGTPAPVDATGETVTSDVAPDSSVSIDMADLMKAGVDIAAEDAAADETATTQGSSIQTGEHPDALIPSSGGKVLVIDDDPNVRELMTRYLGSQGFDITTASDGIEGLQRAKELKPTVITLDAMMPGLDGWAVLAALKADAETADIPVIMVTMIDNQQRGEVMGASEFIVKPIVWGRLARLLAKYTGEQRERTVLVVDDDAAARELMRRNLQRDGWQIVEAEHGKAALEILENLKPAAILLDLMMPVMDGFEFLAEFNKREIAEQIPVIVVTSKDPTSSEANDLQRRGVGVMQKGSHSQETLLREIHRRVDRLSQTSTTPQGET